MAAESVPLNNATVPSSPNSPQPHPIVTSPFNGPRLVTPSTLTTIPPSQVQAASARNWAALVTFSEEWFYKPDMMALAGMMAGYASHFDIQLPSIWMFVIGPSGSGKTSHLLNCLSQLPNAWMLGDITPKTFLSGYIGNKNASLLHQMGPSAVGLFKDFTTVLSMRQEARAEIGSQFREISDGSFNKHTGGGEELKWEGKLSCFAAVTPAVDKYWGFLKIMGNRFINLRMERQPGMEVAAYTRKQQGRERDIKLELQRLAKIFFCGPPPITYPPPQLSDAQGNRLDAMAEISAYLIGHVERDANSNSREIRESPQVDQTGRLGKSLPTIARYHAALHRKSAIDEDDLTVATRVAFDTMPPARSIIIRLIPHDDMIGIIDLEEQSGLTRGTLTWNMDELIALKIVEEVPGCPETTYRMTPYIKSLWRIAFNSGG